MSDQENRTDQAETVGEQTGQLNKQFGEENKPYVDPNSGAAPQPGGQVAGGLPPEVAEKLEKEAEEAGDEPTDPGYDATIETQAAPQNAQPANPDNENAAEDGTTKDEQGAGHEETPSVGQSDESADAKASKKGRRPRV